MTLTDQVIRNIVSRVIKSQDYRIEIVNLINAEFLQFAIDFFKKVVEAKLNSTDITIEWYKNAFINNALPPEDIAINVSESLIVINTLAVKRAALRGGMWSTAGKRAEKFLMLTLCKLYKVGSQNYNAKHFVKNRELDVDREIDFYLINQGNQYKCEVKLMGQGNPESADAIIARGSNVFVADTLSQQNKNQCDQLNVSWVACRDKDGYKRFEQVLQRFNIPYTKYNGNLDEDLPKILDTII